MSQHDYILDNTSGASFRGDINNALLAIVSQNSGAVAPAATYAYMFWVDTSVTPALLRQRNAANSAWVPVCSLDNWALVSVQLLSATRAILTGTAPAYVATLVPATSGMKVVHGVVNTSTLNGASTLAVNGDAAKSIKQYDSSGIKVNAKLVAGMHCTFEDDGVDWILINPLSGNGATGGSGDYVFYEADKYITQSYTIGSSAYTPGVTLTIASPAVFSLTGHNFVEGQCVHLKTTGALPTGILADTEYFVIATGLTVNNFRLSATVGGAALNSSGSQSGVHSIGKIKNAFTPGPVYGANGVIVTGENGTTWSGT